jgi:hypothetical protein
MTKEQLEQGRHRGYCVYGYFNSYCTQTKSCERCDKFVRLGCKIKNKIEEIQTKRILRICKD